MSTPSSAEREVITRRAAAGDAASIQKAVALGIKFNADQWNWYRQQKTRVETTVDLFPQGNRSALLNASEYIARRRSAGLERRPGVISARCKEQIQQHLELIKEQCLPSKYADRGYEEGVRDALLWVLNGGTPPSNYYVARCRECGCTEEDCAYCIKRTGEPCSWVEEDLCSACAPEVRG